MNSNLIMEGVLTPQDIFNLQVDTQARWNKISATPDSIIPPYDFNRDPLDRDSQIGLFEALESDDFAIKQQAIANLSKDINNSDAVKYNVGFEIDTPYKDAAKYVNKEWGFDPLRDNENFYHEQEYLTKTDMGQIWDNTYKGLGRIVGGVATKFGQSLGHTGAAAIAGIGELLSGDIWNGTNKNNAMEIIAENFFTKWFEQSETHIKDQWLPVFKPANWQDKGFWEKLGSGQYWSDELADGAAFMGAMILEAYTFGLVGKSLGLSGVAAKSVLSGSGTTANLIRGASKLLTGADDWGGVATWALTTSGEAMFEGSSVFKAEKEQLLAERENGKNNFTDEEINLKSGDKAALSFKGNMAVLALSNAFENRMIFQPLLKRNKFLRGKFEDEGIVTGENAFGRNIKVEETPKDLVDFGKADFKNPLDKKFYNIKESLTNPLGRISFYGSRAAKATMMEAYWEENAQLAVERLSHSDNLSIETFVDSYFDQIADATFGRDKEAADSIGAGFVIGSGGVNLTAKATRERKKLIKGTKDAISKYEKARKSYLNLQDVFKRDEQGNLIKRQDDLGYEIDKDKAESLLLGMNEHLRKQITIDNIENPILRKVLQENLLSDYVLAAKSAGIHNTVLNRFDKLSNLTPQQIVKLGFSPDTAQDIGSFQRAFKEQSDIYDSVFLNKKTVDKPKSVNNAEFEEKDWLRKANVYSSLITKRGLENAIKEFTSLEIQNDPEGVLKSPSSIFRLHESLAIQQLKLAEFAATLPKDSEFYKEFISKKQLELANKRLDAMKFIAELSDKEDGSTTKFVYPKLIDSGNGEYKIVDVEVTLDQKELSDVLNEKGEIIDGKHKEALKLLQKIESDFSIHASIQNAIAQQDYIIEKLTDTKKGYQNFLKLKEHGESIKNVDEVVNKANATEIEKKIEEEDLAEKKRLEEEEAKKKAEEEEQKRKEEEEQKRLAEEKEKERLAEIEWRKNNPLEAARLDLILAFAQLIDTLALTTEEKEQWKKILEEENIVDAINPLLVEYYSDNAFNAEEQEKMNIAVAANHAYNELKKQQLSGGGGTETEEQRLAREAEEKRKKDEEEAKRKADEEEKRRLEEKRIKEEEEKKRLEELKKKEEEERLKREQEALRKKATESKNLQELKAVLKTGRLTESINKPNVYEYSSAFAKTKVIIDPENLSAYIKFTGGVIGLNEDGHDKKFDNSQDAFDYVNEQINIYQEKYLETKGFPKNPTLTPEAEEALIEAFAISERASNKNVSYEQELRDEGFIQDENNLDKIIDQAREDGFVTVLSSVPGENDDNSKEGNVNMPKPYQQAKFAFLDKLKANGNIEDFKLILSIAGNGKIEARVADKNGNILKFNTKGEIDNQGVNVIFYLEFITYEGHSIDKPRAVAARTKLDPRVLVHKNFQLHPSFKDNNGNAISDAKDVIVDFIKNNTVTASIDLVTQGQLVRPGITNDLMSLTDLSGKRKTLTELLEEGKTYKGDKGGFVITDPNPYMRIGRIQVKFKKNINDENEGYEVVEFKPSKIKDMVDENGQSLKDLIEPLLKQALNGSLDIKYHGLLRTILDKRKFLILPLGNTVMVLNRKKFTDYFVSLNKAITADLMATEIVNLTSLEELMDSPMNIDSNFYEKEEDELRRIALDFPSEFDSFISNYGKLVRNNVTSSASEVKINENRTGVARTNKRIVVTLDTKFEDMKNDKLKKSQEENSNPEKINITPEGDLSTEGFLSILSEPEKSDEEIENLLNGIINKQC